jgi:hypothetical protein
VYRTGRGALSTLALRLIRCPRMRFSPDESAAGIRNAHDALLLGRAHHHPDPPRQLAQPWRRLLSCLRFPEMISRLRFLVRQVSGCLRFPCLTLLSVGPTTTPRPLSRPLLILHLLHIRR